MPCCHVLNSHQLTASKCHNIGGNSNCIAGCHVLVILIAPAQFEEINLIREDLLYLRISDELACHVQLLQVLIDEGDPTHLAALIGLLSQLSLCTIHDVLVEHVSHRVTTSLCLLPLVVLILDKLAEDKVTTNKANLTEENHLCLVSLLECDQQLNAEEIVGESIGVCLLSVILTTLLNENQCVMSLRSNDWQLHLWPVLVDSSIDIVGDNVLATVSSSHANRRIQYLIGIMLKWQCILNWHLIFHH